MLVYMCVCKCVQVIVVVGGDMWSLEDFQNECYWPIMKIAELSLKCQHLGYIYEQLSQSLWPYPRRIWRMYDF